MSRLWKGIALLCMALSLALPAVGQTDQSRIVGRVTAPQGAVVSEADEIQQMKAQLASQQAQIKQLQAAIENQRKALESATVGAIAAASAATFPAVARSAQGQPDLSAQMGQLEKEIADTKKSVEERIKGIGPFTFSGDIRVRYEPFFGSGPANSAAPQVRHRERIRLRLNASAKFSDEFAGGLSLASGDAGDPISTNQTLTGFFARKPFLLDKAFVTYSPHWLKPFQITAGKWAYTWYRTELTWDNDLNPEGVSESVSFNWKNSPLQRLAMVGFQMPFLEVSGGPDSAVFGGQLQAGWKLHNRIKLGTHLAYYDYHNANSIAANQSNGLGAFSSGTSTGLGGTFGFGGGAFTNYSGTINGVRTFASRFGIVDAIARFDVDTGVARFPLMLQFDFAQNTRACQNLGAFAAAGVNPPACNPRDRQAHWAEVQLGRTQNTRDLRLGYTLIRIERDAVLSAFNFSDLRQPTNVANHRMEVAYQAYGNITLSFTGLIGRQLGLVSSGTPPTPVAERYLMRLQFDLAYKF